MSLAKWNGCEDVDNSDYRMLPMRSTCPQTKYLFDTEGTPILSEEVERLEVRHILKLCQSFLQRSKVSFWKKGPRKLQCEKTSLRFFFAGAWRDAHQKCFGARTLSSLPASLRLWEGIPVDSCWLGKKYVPPVLSFSREILTFLCCLDFHQAVYSILFVYLPHCLSFYSYIWDVCILTIHMPICLVVPIFLSLCLPSYFSITQLPNCWSINSSIRPSIHPHGVFNLHGAFLNLCEF